VYRNGLEAVKGFKKDVDNGKIIIDVKSILAAEGDYEPSFDSLQERIEWMEFAVGDKNWRMYEEDYSDVVLDIEEWNENNENNSKLSNLVKRYKKRTGWMEEYLGAEYDFSQKSAESFAAEEKPICKCGTYCEGDPRCLEQECLDCEKISHQHCGDGRKAYVNCAFCKSFNVRPTNLDEWRKSKGLEPLNIDFSQKSAESFSAESPSPLTWPPETGCEHCKYYYKKGRDVCSACDFYFEFEAESFSALDYELNRNDCCELWVEKLYDGGKIGFGEAGNLLAAIEMDGLKCSQLGSAKCHKKAESFSADENKGYCVYCGEGSQIGIGGDYLPSCGKYVCTDIGDCYTDHLERCGVCAEIENKNWNNPNFFIWDYKKDAESHDFSQKSAESFSAENKNKNRKNIRLTPKELKYLNMMKSNYNDFAYVEVDNRGWKPYKPRFVEGLLKKGIISIPKDQNRGFYGEVEDLEAYIVIINPIAAKYPYKNPFPSSPALYEDEWIKTQKQNITPAVKQGAVGDKGYEISAREYFEKHDEVKNEHKYYAFFTITDNGRKTYWAFYGRLSGYGRSSSVALLELQNWVRYGDKIRERFNTYNHIGAVIPLEIEVKAVQAIEARKNGSLTGEKRKKRTNSKTKEEPSKSMNPYERMARKRMGLGAETMSNMEWLKKSNKSIRDKSYNCAYDCGSYVATKGDTCYNCTYGAESFSAEEIILTARLWENGPIEKQWLIDDEDDEVVGEIVLTYNYTDSLRIGHGNPPQRGTRKEYHFKIDRYNLQGNSDDIEWKEEGSKYPTIKSALKSFTKKYAEYKGKDGFDAESFEAEFTYGYTDEDDEWDEDYNPSFYNDKYRAREAVMGGIMKMPTEKGWRYIHGLHDEDGAVSDEVLEEWREAVAENDLEKAVRNVVRKRDYISEEWANRIVDELKSNNYYQAESFEAERGCYSCPDCGTMMYETATQYGHFGSFGTHCACWKCGSNYISKEMNAEDLTAYQWVMQEIRDGGSLETQAYDYLAMTFTPEELDAGANDSLRRGNKEVALDFVKAINRQKFINEFQAQENR
tara:strand:- start:30 stop:3185 length:3156 start_codon:yes stop_codon:yes gene_type:complete